MGVLQDGGIPLLPEGVVGTSLHAVGVDPLVGPVLVGPRVAASVAQGRIPQL